MTNEEARAIFNEVISKQTDEAKIAKLEVLREYFTNPEFRANLEEFTFNLNNNTEESAE